MGRARLARRKAYARNQRLKAPQDETTDSKPGGHGLGGTAHPPAEVGGELPGWVMSPDGEATAKACGVVVAMVQGHSWVPIPSKGSRMNVGTVPALPTRRRRQRRIRPGEHMAC